VKFGTQSCSAASTIPGWVIAVAIFSCSSIAQINPDGSWHPPAPGISNLWFKHTNSDTVFVFVHGLNSDSRCWLYEENSQPKQYWPYLVAVDERLGQPSVFLGGYSFGPHYTIFDAVVELDHNLVEQGVLEYPNIIFIAHSMGGVVVRRMLCSFSQQFRRKQIGVMLFASPSAGSRLADLASDLQFLGFHLPQGFSNVDRLRSDSPYLIELDQEFKHLVDGSDRAEEDRLSIKGAEVVEGDDYVANNQVVDRASAARYFDYRTLPGDHSSLVKPATMASPSHQFVVEFFRSSFTRATPPNMPSELHIEVPARTSEEEPGAWQRFSPKSDENWTAEIWSLTQAWISAIRGGDINAIRNFYADRLEYYYGSRNILGDAVAQQMNAAIEKYERRTLDVTNPSFLKIDAENAEVVFEKSYSLSGFNVTTNEGKVIARLRFTRVSGSWKITGQADDKICWSSLMRDPSLRFPPGACR